MTQINTPMKLALLCTSISRGGLELYTMRLARSLKKRGHEVIVISQANSFLEEQLKAQNIKCLTVNKSYQYLCFYTAFKCSKILKELGFEYLMVTNTRDIDLCAFTKSFFMQELTLLYMQQMQLGLIKKSIYFDWKFSKLDRWYAPLEWLREEVCANTNMNQEKIKILPVTIETKSFLDFTEGKEQSRKLFELPEDTFLFGFIGRIDKNKCPEVLLSAFEKLKKDYLPNESISLLIAGDKTSDKGREFAFAQKFELAIANSPYTSCIFRFPFIENVNAAFKALDIFVMSSHKETIGLVTQEAMALGTVVLGADSGGTLELLNYGKCGYIFKSRDVDDLCEKMHRAYLDRNSHNEIREKAIKYVVENFDRAISCQKLEQEMETLQSL